MVHMYEATLTHHYHSLINLKSQLRNRGGVDEATDLEM